MELFLQLLGQYGLPIVFLAVLLAQGGLPLPAYPVVIAASSLAVAAGEPAWPIVPVAATAALLADLAWFAGGRRFGGRMLRLMCSLSLSHDSCVGSARETYQRWGLPSLVIAKFVPGLAAVATTMAGQMRIKPRRFLLYDSAGALLWAAVAVMLGTMFQDIVNDVLMYLDAWGGLGLLVVVAFAASLIGYKAWQRWRFRRQHRMARITVDELRVLMAGDRVPTVVDARSAAERADGWIPGALLPAGLADLDVANGVVVYCDCPDELSAARLARRLAAEGMGLVRPLVGGFKAWKDAGLPVEHAPASEARASRPMISRSASSPIAADPIVAHHAFAGGE